MPQSTCATVLSLLLDHYVLGTWPNPVDLGCCQAFSLHDGMNSTQMLTAILKGGVQSGVSTIAPQISKNLANDVQNGDLSNVRRLSAGFAAGITEALTIVTPFEVVKIKLQQQKGTSKELLRYRVSPQVLPLMLPKACCMP